MKLLMDVFFFTSFSFVKVGLWMVMVECHPIDVIIFRCLLKTLFICPIFSVASKFMTIFLSRGFGEII